MANETQTGCLYMEDRDDLALRRLMGNRFDGGMDGLKPSAVTKRESADPAEKEKRVSVLPNPTPDSEMEKNQVGRLKSCFKAGVAYAVINVVLIYWAISGKLDPSAAWPATVIVALLMGLRIGAKAAEHD